MSSSSSTTRTRGERSMARMVGRGAGVGVEVGAGRHDRQRLGHVAGVDHLGGRAVVAQQRRKALPYKGVIVDDEDLHGREGDRGPGVGASARTPAAKRPSLFPFSVSALTRDDSRAICGPADLARLRQTSPGRRDFGRAPHADHDVSLDVRKSQWSRRLDGSTPRGAVKGNLYGG